MENCNDNLGCTKISIFKSELVSNFRRKQRVLNMDINFWFPKCNKKKYYKFLPEQENNQE